MSEVETVCSQPLHCIMTNYNGGVAVSTAQHWKETNYDMQGEVRRSREGILFSCFVTLNENHDICDCGVTRLL